MKNLIIFAIFTAFAFSSCTTLYQSGQTPDDVYYSPAREVTQTNDLYTRSDNNYQPYSNFEERQIRMSAYDPRWRYLDNYYNYDYSYNPYTYGYNYGYYYNPYYYNSPVYFKGVSIINPRNTTPRMTNLGSYQNNGIDVVNSKSGTSGKFGPYRTYNNSNNNTRQSNNTYNERGSTTPSRSYNTDRSYTPSSSSSSRSSSTPSSSGSGSSVPRNSRGN